MCVPFLSPRFSWCGIGFLSVPDLCFVSFHNSRVLVSEGIFFSINQSIFSLELLFPQQTNSFVYNMYFSQSFSEFLIILLFGNGRRGIFLSFLEVTQYPQKKYSPTNMKNKTLSQVQVDRFFFSSSWEANCGLIITGNLSSKYYPAAKALVTVWVVVKLKQGIARYRVPRNKASPRARVLVFYSKPSSFWLITEPLRKSSHIHRNPDRAVIFTE